MRVAIFGATSAMAISTARLLAQSNHDLILIGRNLSRLQTLANDFVARGAKTVDIEVVELTDLSKHKELVEKVFANSMRVDLVLVASGFLGNQQTAEKCWSSAHEVLHVNFISVASMLTVLANKFEAQGSGTIAVIGSVAGDRGRASNYVYGSAKAGLEAFLQGLRNRLYFKRVRVLTIKPGFVSTPMTSHLAQGPLFVSSDCIAKGILRAVSKNKDVVYLPWFWRFIMLLINHIPEALFKRMKL